MITQRASLIIFVAFCFYLIAVVNSLPSFFYGLTWLSLGLLASSLGVALLSLAGLKCEPRVGRARGHAGWPSLGVDETGADNLDAPTLEIALHNGGSFNKIGVVLEVSLRDLVRDEVVVHGFLLETIAAGQSLNATLPLEHLPRGRHRLEGARLRGSDVLGLFRVSRRLKEVDEIAEDARLFVVGPPLVRALGRERESGFGRALVGRSRQLLTGPGDEVRGTRPYLPGDDLRHVHWKSTARAGELVMREWEHSGRAAALVVWDGLAPDASRATRFTRNSPLQTEVSLALVASLCAMLRQSQVPFALVLAGENRFFAPPNDGNAHSENHAPLGNSLLNALADARGGRAESLEVALSSSGAIRFDAVWIVTTRLSAELEHLSQLGGQGNVQIAFVDEEQSANAEVESLRVAGACVERVEATPETPWPLALERALTRLHDATPHG